MNVPKRFIPVAECESARGWSVPEDVACLADNLAMRLHWLNKAVMVATSIRQSIDQGTTTIESVRGELNRLLGTARCSSVPDTNPMAYTQIEKESELHEQFKVDIEYKSSTGEAVYLVSLSGIVPVRLDRWRAEALYLSLDAALKRET